MKIILLTIYLQLVLLSADTFTIAKTQKTAIIEYNSQVVETNEYLIKRIDYFGLEKFYTGYLIQNVVMKMWICRSRSGWILLMWSDDKQFVCRDIDYENGFEENGIKIRIKGDI